MNSKIRSFLGAGLFLGASLAGAASLDANSTAHIGSFDDTKDDPTGGSVTSSFDNGYAGSEGTMTMAATTTASASFGALHSSSFGSISNALNENGLPDRGFAYSNASFTDVLQFGGLLMDGYQARYVFHIDGTLTHTGAETGFNSGALGFINVTVDDNPSSNNSFATNLIDHQIDVDTVWSTDNFNVNGQTPQNVTITFGTQVALATYESGTHDSFTYGADFSETATLAGIEMLDANGNLVDGWTVTSESGTKYNRIVSTPEPTGILALAAGGVALLRKRRPV